MKTSLSAACGLVLWATSIAAFPASPVERARIFSDCAGRYAALEQHLWMFDGAASEAVRARRQSFIDLIDATLPAAFADGLPGVRVTSWRVNARAAQSDLLYHATFSESEIRRKASLEAAESYIAACDRLLLGA